MSESECFLQYLQQPLCIQVEESSEFARDASNQAINNDQKQTDSPIETSTPILNFTNNKSVQARLDSFTTNQRQQIKVKRGRGRPRKKPLEDERVQLANDLPKHQRINQQRVQLQKKKMIPPLELRKLHSYQVIIPPRPSFEEEPRTLRSKNTPAPPKQQTPISNKQASPALKPNIQTDQPLKKAFKKLTASSQTSKRVNNFINDNSRQQQFLQRRVALQRGRIDLGVSSLFQIAAYAHSHKLISNQTYFQFINQYAEEINTEFIRSLQEQDLADWDFVAFKIIPADHRRIASLLVKLYPDQFIIGTPLFLNKQVDEFMKLIYTISMEEYLHLMDQIDCRSKVSWWKPISIKHHRAIAEIYRTKPENTAPAILTSKPLTSSQLNQLKHQKLAFLTDNTKPGLNKAKQRKLSYIDEKQEQDVEWQSRTRKLGKRGQ